MLQVVLLSGHIQDDRLHSEGEITSQQISYFRVATD
jgi:hypothetical protein